jgi:hypothetical protein
MHWNDAAEDLLNQILQRTPRPERERAEVGLRQAAEDWAAENSLGRVGVQPVIAAYIRLTPEALRPELPLLLESLGLDESDYGPLLSG